MANSRIKTSFYLFFLYFCFQDFDVARWVLIFRFQNKLRTMLNKYTAGILGILLGGFGAHRFYLGQHFWGIVRFLAFVGLVIVTSESYSDAPGILLGMLFLSAFLEGLLFLVMPKERFDKKYNKHQSQVTAPLNIQDLKAEGVDYYRSGDYDLAIEAFSDALAVRADDPGVHFNLACAFAQLRKLPQALHHLELAISYGLIEPERIETHAALEWLRAQPAFASFRQNNYRQLSLVPAMSSNETELQLPDLDQSSDEPTSNTSDLLQSLQALGELHERGIITAKEFAEQKEKLLA